VWRAEVEAAFCFTGLKYPVKSKLWYDRKTNEQVANDLMWAAPIDPRFPQQSKAKCVRACMGIQWVVQMVLHILFGLSALHYAER
jgi:hypothetical protein